MTKRKIVALVLALATVFTLCFTLIACTNDNTPDETAIETAQSEKVNTLAATDFKTELVSTNGVMLLSASPMALAANSSYVEQTLTATVLPATASNKTVDWSVAWADSTNTADVTDYVTVTPASNGNTTATVTCKAKFTGNIVITVTTRESGYTAECIVSFVGKPTDITVSSSLTAQSDGYHVGIGNAYTFNIGLTNPFNSVGADYQNITVEVGAVGSVVLASKEYYVSSGNTTWYEGTIVTLESLKDKFITANYANGVLTVNTLKTIESYYESMERIDSGRTRYYTNAFKEYASDCYFTVKITETNSGLSETIKIHFDDSVVTSVSVNTPEMSF
ncbi:MAG: hypothetical protein IJ426_06165 [Clostridia bacterium]|nr:hypothetical protein [Clostridia bacterium]